MKNNILLWLFVLCIGLPLKTFAANSYPIVLVHGWIGWGTSEMNGYRYWGGNNYDVAQDIEDHLASTTGTQVHTAAVGPISSNWDRAVELYAQIRGMRVDYGIAHSHDAGHDRLGDIEHGMDFTGRGFHENWSSENKIHLLTHSMGGTTARLLVHLLEHGSPENWDGDPESLFAGGRGDWVSSVTTLATPHNGTTLANGITQLNYAEDLLGMFFAALDSMGLDDVYNMKLHHFNLHKQEGQSWGNYLSSNLTDFIKNGHTPVGMTLDQSGYDLSPEGSRKLNGMVKANPEVYYLSYAYERTKNETQTECGWKGFLWMCWQESIETHEPKSGMQKLMKPLALLMGNCSEEDSCPSHYEPANPVDIDASWHRNDGIINTVSARGPTLNSTDEIVDYDGQTLHKGKWNYMGLTTGLDHLQATGVDLLDLGPAVCKARFSAFTCWGIDLGVELINTNMDSRLPQKYRDLATMLSNLPN